MITVTVIAVLAILLVLVLRAMRAVVRKPLPKPAEDLGNIRVGDARAGDSISIPGAGDQFSDLDFMVEHRNRYDVGARQWVELRGSYRDRRVSVLVSSGDQTDVGVALDARRLTLEDMALSEQDLSTMDERQNTADFFEFEGKPWYYRLSKEFVLLRDSASQGGSFYGWLFEEVGGKRTILVRKPEGEGFWASVAARVNPTDLTVFRAA